MAQGMRYANQVFILHSFHLCTFFFSFCGFIIISWHNLSYQALLAGCSAGGVSTILHCDEFRGLFPSNTKVKCLADAGMFLDTYVHANRWNLLSYNLCYSIKCLFPIDQLYTNAHWSLNHVQCWCFWSSGNEIILQWHCEIAGMCHFGGHIVLFLFLFFLAANPTSTYGAPTSLYHNNFVPISVISFFLQCSNT